MYFDLLKHLFFVVQKKDALIILTSDFEMLVLILANILYLSPLVGVPNQCFLLQIIVFKVGGWV